jgi:NAD(P)-dependent dehydrogenase (short-subunit alcohol dehydrogenase family)
LTTEKSEELSILITGSSTGFGELIAKTMARSGHHVFATMRNTASRNKPAAEALLALARDEGLKIDVLDLDVTLDDSVTTAIDEAFARAGRIDVVVNNAGATRRGPLEAFSMDEIQGLFNLNVFGPMRVNKAVLPSMRARGSGLLLHISSTLGRVLAGGGGLYPSTKWALEGLAESFHHQLKPFGVESILVEPGSYPTPAIVDPPWASGVEITKAYQARTPPPAPRPHLLTESDNQEVADVVKQIIEMPAGTRPLRTVVGSVMTDGVTEYNQFYEATKERSRNGMGKIIPAPGLAEQLSAARG